MTAASVPSSVPSKNNSALLVLFGLAAALLILFTLTGKAAASGISDRTAFLITAGITFAMCAFSPLGKGAVYGWLNPLHIAGYVLGALLLALIAAVLFNIPLGVPLPAWLTAHSGMPALAVLTGCKIIISFLYPRRK